MAKSAESVAAIGWAARDTSGELCPFNFKRRATGDHDVTFKVLYCGVCHTDYHLIKNEWLETNYPLVPGHELVGIVTEVGGKVKNFEVGDNIGVGIMIGSCHSCDFCHRHLENYCAELKEIFNDTYYDGTHTYGGFSDIMVVDEYFVLHWPKKWPLAEGAPLICAGITTYGALKYFDLNKPGMHVGVVGLGGLGHLAAKFAKAFGVKVTVISTSPSKKDTTITHLGAESFLDSNDTKQMEAVTGTLDGIIDTVPEPHPIMPLINILKSHGKLIMVSEPEKPVELHTIPVLLQRKIISGSIIGGVKETQEMLEFAANHNIKSDIELISIEDVNKTMEPLVKNKVPFRFVIDIGNTLKPTA